MENSHECTLVILLHLLLQLSYPRAMSEKIQKVLARAGLGSRRELERLVADRKISVNGKIIEVGARVEEGDVIRVNGNIIKESLWDERPTRVLLYNKPEGEVCSRSDEKGRATVFDKLPKMKTGRWIGVGRLDVNTTGLLLFTTNGELADRLMHPSYEVARDYMVRIYGIPQESHIEAMLNGVELEDGFARFTSIRAQGGDGGEGRNVWFRVSLNEGRNREVKRLFESQGFTVSRLHRIQFGPIEVPRSLRMGKFRELDKDLIQKLLASVQLSAPIYTKKPRK